MGLLGVQERTLRGPGFDYSEFSADVGFVLLELFGYLGPKKEFFHACLQVFFGDFLGLNLDVWGLILEEQVFGIRGFAKNTFTEVGSLMIPGSICDDFGWQLGNISKLSWRWASNSMIFQGHSEAHPDPATILEGGKLFIAGLNYNNPRITQNIVAVVEVLAPDK